MWRTFSQLALADWRERVRRHAFLVTLLVTVWFGWVALPPNHSVYATLQIQGARGLYNSACVGSVTAMLTSIFLSIAGFYVVKNAVERDRRTGVGAILATTPISKPVYTLGKAASNFMVLASVVLAAMVTAAATQLARGEDRHLDPVAIALPFLLITLPTTALTASFAVLFETIPGLRGGVGNALWIFVSIGLLSAPSASNFDRGKPVIDPLGVSAVVTDMRQAYVRAFPGARSDRGMSIGFNFRAHGVWDLELFRWEGPAWNASRIAGRLVWYGVAIMIALLAAIPFDRFERDRTWRAARSSRPRGRRAESLAEEAAVPEVSLAVRHASALPAVRAGRTFWPLLSAELVLALRRRPKAWWFVALGLFVAECFAPLAVARAWLLPFAWIWPLLIWSEQGARDQRYQTVPLVFTSPRPVIRPALATWIAGTLVAMGAGLPVGVRLAGSGDMAGLAAWSSGALFIPAFALASGTWTGGGKLFEGLYTFLWYAGPLQHIPLLDFAGSTAENVAGGAWIWFAGGAAALFSFTILGRRRLMA